MHQYFQRLIDSLDDALRHRSLLGEHRVLRRFLRKPYHYLMNLHGRGITVHLGHCVDARVPAEFASKLMEDYEADEFRVINEWCVANPKGLFVDVGCSLGYMSCAALFSGPSVEVLAIDSDLNSLKATHRVCSCAAGTGRLHLLHGLIAGITSSSEAWSSIAMSTRERLRDPGVSGNPDDHHYVYLDDAAAGGDIPFYRLDDLLAREIVERRPMLVKCDVEGAECDVLSGAGRLLGNAKPKLLLSVHPKYMSRFGGTRELLCSQLQKAGYCHAVLGVDHEEHWLCVPESI